MSRCLARVCAVLTALAVVAAPAAACSVCYGAADDPVLDGAQAAIVFMLGLVYAVLGGGVAMVWFTRRHRVARVGEEVDG